MFFKGRGQVLKALVVLGASRCSSANANPFAWCSEEHRCDCKYGYPEVGSENTGCPELKSAYLLIASLEDGEYDALVRRVGGVQTSKLFNGDEPTFEQMSAALRDIETLARQVRPL